MFAKLKPSGGGLGLGALGPSSTNSSQSYIGNNNTSVNMTYAGSGLEQNPIVQHFHIGKLSGSAGPELVWRIFDGVRRSDAKVSFQLFSPPPSSLQKLHFAYFE